MSKFEDAIPLLARLGPRCELKFRFEEYEDTEELHIVAYLFESPPESGWSTGRPIDAYDPKCISAVSYTFDEADKLIPGVVSMLSHAVEKRGL